jgi:hypothetical protein
MNPTVPRIYLTLRCNLNCGYCSNGTLLAEYEELTAVEWEQRIRAIRGDEVVFTGGEPTLHREFYEIVQRLSREFVLNVYSNFARPLELSRLPPQPRGIRWRASCHAQTEEDAAQWIENVTVAREAGYPMTLTTVLPPAEVVEALRGHHILVDCPQVKPTPLKAPVRCTLPRVLVAPDGRRFHCVGKLVRKDASGVVGYSDGNTIICQKPNRCAACDSLASKRVPIE